MRTTPVINALESLVIYVFLPFEQYHFVEINPTITNDKVNSFFCLDHVDLILSIEIMSWKKIYIGVHNDL